MNVKLCGPVRGIGKRTPLCKGDEARVSRICLGSGKKDLVERVQSLHSSNPFSEHDFIILLRPGLGLAPDRNIRWLPASAAYHLQKFFSLRLAKALFPESFPECKEIRFFARSGRRLAAAYSGFVEDENGVVARRANNMRQYYRILHPQKDTERFEHARAFRTQCDERENTLNPALAPLVRRICTSGIIISHPEANYHMQNGKTVLFEANGIRLMRAYAASCASPNRKAALDALSTMLSIGILDAALHNAEEMQTFYPFLSFATRQDGLWVMLSIKRVILDFFGNDERSRYLLYDMHADDSKALFYSLNALFGLSNEELWTQCNGAPEDDLELQPIVRLLLSDLKPAKKYAYPILA
jgi:hypothetical protein